MENAIESKEFRILRWWGRKVKSWITTTTWTENFCHSCVDEIFPPTYIFTTLNFRHNNFSIFFLVHYAVSFFLGGKYLNDSATLLQVDCAADQRVNSGKVWTTTKYVWSQHNFFFSSARKIYAWENFSGKLYFFSSLHFLKAFDFFMQILELSRRGETRSLFVAVWIKDVHWQRRVYVEKEWKKIFNNSYQTFIYRCSKAESMNCEIQMKYLKIIYQVLTAAHSRYLKCTCSLMQQHRREKKIWQRKKKILYEKLKSSKSAIKCHLVSSSSSFILSSAFRAVEAFFLCAFLFTVLPNTRTLRVSKIIVPPFIDVRNIASLECIYEIGNRKLNSVKWYKNDKEFFRWAQKKKVLFSKVERCSRSDDELNRVVYLSMKLDAVQSIYMKWNPLCKWITKYLATEDVSASLALTHTVLAFFLLFFSSMRSISNANMNSNLLLLRDLLRLQKARRMQPFFVLIPFFMCTRFSLVLPPL